MSHDTTTSRKGHLQTIWVTNGFSPMLQKVGTPHCNWDVCYRIPYINQLTTSPSLYIFITDLITPTDTEGTTTTNEEEGSLPRSTSTNTSGNPSVTTTNDNKQHALQPSTQLTNPHNEELDEYKNQENVPPPSSQAHISSASPVLADMDLFQQHETHHLPAIDIITTTTNIVESNSRALTRHHTTISHTTGRRRAEILVTAAPTSKHNQIQQQPPIQPSIPLELLEAARRKGIEMAVERERHMAEEEMRQEKEWQQKQQERASAAAVVINSTMAPVYMKRKKDHNDNNSVRPITRSQQSSKPLTIPKSPAFMLMSRTAQYDVIKSTEQLELECIQKEKVTEARLRQRNAVTLKSAMAPPPPPPQNHNKKQLYTVPEGIQLATAARQRVLSIMASSSLSSGRSHHHTVIMKEEDVRAAVEEEAIKAFISAPFNTDMFVTRRSDYYHQNEAGRKRKRAESGRGGGGGTTLQNTQQQQQHQGLTLAKSPNFATKRRARPSRFKPTEQQAFEEMEAARAKRFSGHQQNKLNNKNNSNMMRNYHHQQPLSSSQEVHQLDALVSRTQIKPAIAVTGTATKTDDNSVVNRTDTEDASTEKVGAAGEAAASKLRRTTLHIGKALRVPVSTIDQQVEYEADQVAADMMNKQE